VGDAISPASGSERVEQGVSLPLVAMPLAQISPVLRQNGPVEVSIFTV